MSISRRHFLAAPALAALSKEAVAASVDPKTGMPMRVLGKTGASVSILAFGCGSRFGMYKEDDKALEAGARALAAGINYMDTAQAYGSEERVGKLLKGRRAGVWLATKIQERNGDKAMSNMEMSLKRLQTDQVDLVHIHSLLGPEDLAAIEAKGGLLETLYKIKGQKMTRFIGVTSHTDPVTLKNALERHDFDCTQMALNAALVGMRSGRGGMVPNPDIKESFEKIALPVALRKKMGVTAMKAYAQGPLTEKASPEKLVRYAMTLPVGSVVVGMPSLEFIDDNARIARGFKPLSTADMDAMSGELSKIYKASLDQFFSTHVDS